MKVTITIKNLQKKIPINRRQIRCAVLEILSRENVKKPTEVNFCFVNDTAIKGFNLRYCGSNKPTDVLAFDNSRSKKEISADIVISADTAIHNARTYDTTPRHELYLYVIHGVLHILGYDDNNKKNRLIMQKKEQHYIRGLVLSP